jgi:hypothetical protein
MSVVHGRADARRLPSRHRFALFRLAAFLASRNAQPEPANVSLFLDRDQNAIDHYAASLWIVLTLTCYTAGTLFAGWPVAAALAISFPIAAAALQALIVFVGLVAGPAAAARRHRMSSFVMMALLMVLAAHFARGTSWVRFAAWQFLAVIALNALAAVIVYLLRRPIARLESAVIGGASSAP